MLGILVWQEGGESVAALLLLGAAALGGLVLWLRRRKRLNKPTLLEPELFSSAICASYWGPVDSRVFAPGHTTLARTPCSLSSVESAIVRPLTPPLPAG